LVSLSAGVTSMSELMRPIPLERVMAISKLLPPV
jgi:hypothetical protein